MQKTALYHENSIYPNDHRLSRMRFLWFIMFPITCLMALKWLMAYLGILPMAMLHDLFSIILQPFLLIFAVYCMSNIIRRLHDLNQNGWYACFSILPYFNIAFFLYLLWMPGYQHENIYGPAADSNKQVDYLFTLLFGLPGLVVAAYYYPNYLSWVNYLWDKFSDFILWIF